MNCVKLQKLYQIVPSFLKILDKFLFSKPFIEKFSNFEMKTLLVLYAIAIGVFLDNRANKTTRNVLLGYHIVCDILVLGFCGFYLTDLLVYDVESVTLGLVHVIFITIKIFLVISEFYLFDVIEKLIEFFIDDYNRSCFTIPSKEIIQECINMKKWVLVLFSVFLGTSFLPAAVFFGSEMETKTSGITKRSHLMIYFPMWCPFENLWAKKAILFFQAVVILPEVLLFVSTALMTLIFIIKIHNKLTMLFTKLKLFSERTFERIGIFDRQIEEAMYITNERIRSNVIKGLHEERMSTVTKFYLDFIQYMERYQHLKRAQFLLKTILDCTCSISYCLSLLAMIGFGFVGTQTLSSIEHEFKFSLKTLMWFSNSGISWYMTCIIGELFSQLNDSFIERVYSMPWYHFSPKQRRTVFTLLTIIQKPIYLRALKLVNVKKDAFPEFLNSVYSYLQIMRTLQKAKFKET